MNNPIVIVQKVWNCQHSPGFPAGGNIQRNDGLSSGVVEVERRLSVVVVEAKPYQRFATISVCASSRSLFGTSLQNNVE